MSKEDILAEYQTDFTDPGSEKSGEYLHEHIIQRTNTLISIDREGVIDVCRDWLLLRDDPFTMLALNIIKTYKLAELKTELCQLKNDIEEEKAFLPYYVRWVDESISAVSDTSR